LKNGNGTEEDQAGPAPKNIKPEIKPSMGMERITVCQKRV
jgi:hypothetical protein